MQHGTYQLSDLFRDLSFGELSNLSLANDGNGTIKDTAQPRIVLYANEALLRIYSKFVIRERDCLIRMYKHITNYHLLPKFAINAGEGFTPPEKIRYILDLPNEPFQDDTIMIMSVFDSEGIRIPLNDEHRGSSVFTPQPKVLQVPMPEEGKVLSVGYQCQHEKLETGVNEYLFVPETLMGALRSYIAYKVFSHMNTQESTVKAQEHMALYEAICAEALEKNTLSTSPSNSFNRFELRGWV